MSAIPRLVLPPESMPWGRWVQDVLSELRTQASLRAQGEDMTNNTQAATIRTLQQLVGNLQTQVAEAIAQSSYTATQIDTKIANPGNVNSSGSISATGNISASGQVSSVQPLKSPGSHGYNVTSSYVAGWIDGDGTLGTSPSTGLVKTSLTPMTATDAQKLLNLTPYWGRYVWDSDTSPLKVFFLAEDVRAAGFGPDVAPVVIDEPLSLVNPDGTPVLDSSGNPAVVPVGEAWTVNYSQMVVPLIAAWHDGAEKMSAMQAQIDALNARLTAAGIA